jgi:hypothetical protein
MFNPLKEILILDIDWMKANGWTLRGMLAYRHILYEYSHSGIPSQRKIMEILKKYDAEKYTYRIDEALRSLIELNNYLINL